ncbi:MAG: DUF1697 domain-containing protein [Abitibacteriaceae bacterium]|nr:DUF1697 domain-containing protein [Abditibacteriaceae bacterium]
MVSSAPEPTLYIAFLRGINVGGHVAKMERLRALFGELGCTEVRSYIQSGNIFFQTTEADRAALTHQIEQHLAEALGYEVPVFLRTIAEVEQLLLLDPFRQVEVTPETRLFIIFTSEPLPADLALPLYSPKRDFAIVQTMPGAAFVVLRLIDGRAGNPAAFIEKTFKVKATARFFGTTKKILEAAKSS